MVTYYQADAEDPWSYYWIGISGTKVKWFPCAFQPHYAKGFLRENRGDTRGSGCLWSSLSTRQRDSKIPRTTNLHLLSQIHELLFLISEVAPDSRQATHLQLINSTWPASMWLRRIMLKSISSIQKRSPMTSMSIAPTWQLFWSFTRSLPKDFCTQSACSVPSSYWPIQTKASRS